MHKSLCEEFARLKNGHRQAIKERAARVTLGSSVIRAFEENTRAELIPVIARTNIDTLLAIYDQESYSKWFDRLVGRIWHAIAPLNQNRSSIMPGGKWGHSAKIAAIFVREVVLCSRYFPDREAKRLSPLLYVPIDGVIMRRLKTLGVKLPFARIREIETRKQFYDVQKLLGEAANKEKVPRIWFDDNWTTQT